MLTDREVSCIKNVFPLFYILKENLKYDINNIWAIKLKYNAKKDGTI